ncbi:hypothetical protein HTG_10675 [Natrinema mahii]|nr:hypothetical protein HTG_10675 [Natrinema mahii]
MVDRDELRGQIVEAVEDASYPVTDIMELVPALPRGPSTRFESGDFSTTPMELSMDIPQGSLNFPYETPEDFADDLLDEMEKAEII